MSCVGLSPSRLMPAMLLASLVLVGVKTPANSQEHALDEHTLLLLHCNGNLDGAQGESPVQALGISFAPGIFGGATHFGAANEVRFAGAGNISSMQGTLEFWIKPAWNGEDGQTHVLL